MKPLQSSETMTYFWFGKFLVNKSDDRKFVRFQKKTYERVDEMKEFGDFEKQISFVTIEMKPIMDGFLLFF